MRFASRCRHICTTAAPWDRKASAALALAACLVIAAVAGSVSASSAEADEAGQGIARGNTEIDRYMEANWNEELTQGLPYPARSPRLHLQGSWQQMGVQYGEAVGPSIRAVYDALYTQWLGSGVDPDDLPAVLDMYVAEIRHLGPEMVQFMRGISKGAGDDLDAALHADALDDFHKIVFMNSLFEVVIPPAWNHLRGLVDGDSTTSAAAEGMEFHSHAWAAFGSATSHGGALAGGTRDQPWFPLFYSAAYVAVPNDPKANVVFGHTIAGMVAASNQVNDQGVFIGNTIVSSPEQELGVPGLVATAYASFFADSAQEAADIFTVGTDQYRKRTRRDTLAYTVGFNQLVADPDEAFVVERTAGRYAVRGSGDDGETDYVVVPNHNIAEFSYDETATRTEQPMTDFGASAGGSSMHRYNALYWEIAYNLGAIDVEFAIDELAQMNHYYDDDGQRVDEVGGVPVWRLGDTPQRFLFADPEDPDGFPRGGNLMYVVADLDNLDVYYTQGIPDHWSGPWDHVWLGDPAYRLPQRR